MQEIKVVIPHSTNHKGFPPDLFTTGLTVPLLLTKTYRTKLQIWRQVMVIHGRLTVIPSMISGFIKIHDSTCNSNS